MANFPFWCDVCGDIVKAVYPCKFVFHDKREIPFDICLDCMETGVLAIDLSRRKLISILLEKMRKG